MNVAIMQPYFLPYQGFFNLISSVDLFVIYDDAQYVSRSWINRNRLLDKTGSDWLLTIPVSKSPQKSKINQIQVSENFDTNSLNRRVSSNYNSALNFRDGYEVFKAVTQSGNTQQKLLSVLQNSMKIVSSYLNLKTRFILASDLKIGESLKNQDRIIEICKIVNASSYVNLPGGRSLYTKDRFLNEGLELKFIEPLLNPYIQISKGFTPAMSIMDLLFSVSANEAEIRVKNDYSIEN